MMMNQKLIVMMKVFVQAAVAAKAQVKTVMTTPVAVAAMTVKVSRMRSRVTWRLRPVAAAVVAQHLTLPLLMLLHLLLLHLLQVVTKQQELRYPRLQLHLHLFVAMSFRKLPESCRPKE